MVKKNHILEVRKELDEPIEHTNVRESLKEHEIDFNEDLSDEALLELLPRKEKIFKCILREPTFKEYIGAMGALVQPSGNRNIALAGEFIIQACWVEGDDIIRDDAGLLYSASLEAFGLLSFYETELKKK